MTLLSSATNLVTLNFGNKIGQVAYHLSVSHVYLHLVAGPSLVNNTEINTLEFSYNYTTQSYLPNE